MIMIMRPRALLNTPEILDVQLMKSKNNLVRSFENTDPCFLKRFIVNCAEKIKSVGEREEGKWCPVIILCPCSRDKDTGFSSTPEIDLITGRQPHREHTHTRTHAHTPAHTQADAQAHISTNVDTKWQTRNMLQVYFYCQ